MSVYYHDSSALIKHYHTEIGTAMVDTILGDLCEIASAEGFTVINPATTTP